MFEISIIILSRLLLVAIGFWVYRMFYQWDDIERPVIGSIRGQQGYVSLYLSASKQAKTVKLKKGNVELRTPWGW